MGERNGWRRSRWKRLVLCGLLLLDYTVSYAAVTFQPATNFPVGTDPFAVIMEDLDGDAALDLAIANRGSNTVSVLLGDGTGGFVAAAGSPFTVGTSPRSLVAGDFNGDRKLDLAIANRDSTPPALNNVSILLGDGTGSFAPHTTFSTGTSGTNRPFSIVTGDLDGDSDLDLVVANRDDNSISILSGNNTGAFALSSVMSLAPAIAPFSIAIGRYNGDNYLDLAVSNRDSNNVTILLGNGNLTFSNAVGSPFAAGTQPHVVAVGDVNGNNQLDLVFANRGNATLTTRGVSVLLGSGAGSFGAATSFSASAGMRPFAVAMADLDGMSGLDLAVTNRDNDTFSIYLGDRTGNFGVPTDFLTSDDPTAIAIGDLNGDAKPDVAITNALSNTVSVLLNNTTFPAASAAATAGSFQTVEVTALFPQALQVTVRDALNAPVPNVVVTFTPPASGASATLSSLTAITNVNGIATVTATANTSIGTYIVTATAPGVVTPVRFTLTNLDLTTSPPPVANVPVSSPFGLFVLAAFLVGFGTRRLRRSSSH